MNYTETNIPGIWIMEPKVFPDARGYFMEAFKQSDFEHHIGPTHFIQDNESCSARGVLRGMHYQLAPYAQAKLVRVIVGTVVDVAVDIRRGSPTFGQYVMVELSAENRRQFYIPRGFAHGFYVKSETAIFTYKIDNPYMPTHERGFRFDDPAVGIQWGIEDRASILTSEKDCVLPLMRDAEMNFFEN